MKQPVSCFRHWARDLAELLNKLKGQVFAEAPFGELQGKTKGAFLGGKG